MHYGYYYEENIKQLPWNFGAQILLLCDFRNENMLILKSSLQRKFSRAIQIYEY